MSQVLDRAASALGQKSRRGAGEAVEGEMMFEEWYQAQKWGHHKNDMERCWQAAFTAGATARQAQDAGIAS